MNQNTTAVQSIIKDIISMKKALKKLTGKGKPYEQVLNYLIKNYTSFKYSLHPLNAAELSKNIGISYSSIQKQLYLLHSEILELAEKGKLFKIRKCTYIFRANNYKNNLIVKYHDLPSVPRKGEIVSMPCFFHYFHIDTFYVESVIHEYKDNEVITTLCLEPGIPNSYLDFKYDEARFKNYFPGNDFLDKSKASIGKMILKEIGNSELSS